jgi:uncharacterized DUF497 family protein
MIKLPWPPEFDWDEGNRDKSRRDHGISWEETEDVFWDPAVLIVPDPTHSESEGRYLAYGENDSGKKLLVSFTMRPKGIRPISTRRANSRERKKYEKWNT